MASLVLNGNTSGSVTISSPSVSGTNTLTLPASTGTVLITNGSGVASVNGVQFPATQSASADANTLDDYEQGTFTPTLTGTTQSGGTVSGRYTKIGNVVYVSVSFDNVTLASSAGAATIASLPFTVLSSTAISSGVLGYNNTTAASSNGGNFNSNTTTFGLYNSGGASNSAFANGSGKYLIMSGFYFTAD